MTDFAKPRPVMSSFWSETDDLTLVQAALLTFGIEHFVEPTGVPVPLANLPDGFQNRIEALRSAIRTKSIKPVAGIPGKDGLLDENTTRIKIDDFVNWCTARGLPHNIPNRAVPQPTTKWPWGDYETRLLNELAAAAERFWVRYDPSDPTTAPTNEQVAAWLVTRDVTERTAKYIATILRRDGLPTGPRKQQSTAPIDSK
jgi:hypothetical protein